MTAINPAQYPKVEHRIREFLKSLNSGGGAPIETMAPAEAQKILVAFGKLDMLVNNAGIFKFEPFENISVAEFNREFSTNVLGLILTIQEAIRIRGVSSLAGSQFPAQWNPLFRNEGRRGKSHPRVVAGAWSSQDSSQCHRARLYPQRRYTGGGPSRRGKRAMGASE